MLWNRVLITKAIACSHKNVTFDDNEFIIDKTNDKQICIREAISQ